MQLHLKGNKGAYKLMHGATYPLLFKPSFNHSYFGWPILSEHPLLTITEYAIPNQHIMEAMS